jgi:hypothetical protein
MNDNTIIVGVDNGISGGLCAISYWNGDVCSAISMPTKTVEGKTEVDLLAVLEWADPYRDNMIICIEEPLKHARSSQAMRSMSISFGLLLGAFQARRATTVRIQVKEWQDAILGKRVSKGMTKAVALQQAQKIWPDETWLASKKSRVPHDGMIDAALIARYYRDTHQT